MQKTWIELLGRDARDCKVIGTDIARETRGENEVHYHRLWSCASTHMAQLVFSAWHEEIRLLHAQITEECNRPTPYGC